MDKIQLSDRERLGLNIAYYRRRMKMSQIQFANYINLSRTHLAAIESGSKDPSLALLYRIAEALEVPVSCLFEDR